jgi:hypothetical protein
MVIRKLSSNFLPIILSVALVILSSAFVDCRALPSTFAQTAMATLSGQVTEETGAVVAEVQIVVMNTGTGLRRQTTTNEDGYFILPLLPPGTYTLTAVLPGFAAVTINDLALQVSSNSMIQISLKPKAIAEAIEVKAEGSIAPGDRIDITNATTKYTISNQQVGSLPIFTSDLGRNALSVLPFLIPGVSPTTVFGSGRSDTNRFGQQMSINGGRATSISFYLEGGDNNDEGLGQASSPLPNPDVLQEFTLITNNYQADLGRSSGGVLNAVIKSGTRQFAGNARYLMVNEALNARGFFDPRVPLDRMNTFGGQLGGPLRVPHLVDGRGRILFFFDYEGTRSGREALSTLSLPSAKEREGDFRIGSALPVDPLTRKRFPNGIIPSGRIAPIARLYLEKYIPLPNNGEHDFSRLLLTRFHTSQMTSRWDVNRGDADSLSASYFSTLSTIRADQSALPVGSLTSTHNRNQNLVLRQTHSFSQGRINQITIALTRLIHDLENFAPEASGVSPEALGFTGIHPQNGQFLGAPSVSITGTGVRIATGSDTRRARTGWQIKDDFSRAYGPHAFKVGGEIRSLIENNLVGSDNGSFVFLGVGSRATSSGNSIADFLLGLPFTYSQTSDSARYPRWRAYSFYAMDDWRLRANMTINFGLRFDLAPPIVDKFDQVSAFRPDQQSARFPNAPLGLLFVGDPDAELGTLPRGLYPTDKNNLAPRLGLAYSPAADGGWRRRLFGDHKSALRAGWGVFFDQAFGAGFSRIAATQPFSVSLTLFPSKGDFANPFGLFPNPWPLDRGKRNFFGTTDLEPIEPHFRTAYTHQYNLTLQRELPGAMMLEAAYIGSRSHNLARQREINDALVQPGALLANLQARRRYPNLGSIQQQESSGQARFNALQLTLKRRLTNGLMINGSYVFGKALDDGSSPLLGTVTDPFRWGRSDYDRTHNFVVSYSYDLPRVKLGGFMDGWLNGWQVSGITEFRSGLPLDIAQSVDSTLTGHSQLGTVDVIGPYQRLDPRKSQTLSVDGNLQTGNYFFDPSAFKVVSVNTWTNARSGTLGRNLFDGPGMRLWSLSMLKTIPLESQRIMVRADIRNLFNQANFATPGLLANDPLTFGKVSAAAPGRNVQLSLKYIF